MQGEPQGKLCSLYPSVSKHPRFKQGVSAWKHPQVSLFTFPVLYIWAIPVLNNPTLFPQAQREHGSSLPKETAVNPEETAMNPDKPRDFPIFLLPWQIPSSGSATCRCWAAGSCSTPCPTLAGPLSSTSSWRGCASLTRPSPGWCPSTSASWSHWLRLGIPGTLRNGADGRLHPGDWNGVTMESDPVNQSQK